MEPSQNRKPQKPLNAYAKYSSLGFQMAAIIGGGTYGGHKLDQYYQNSTPVFTIVLSLVSIGIAMYLIFKDLIKPKK